jgi:hypothetical protein
MTAVADALNLTLDDVVRPAWDSGYMDMPRERLGTGGGGLDR